MRLIFQLWVSLLKYNHSDQKAKLYFEQALARMKELQIAPTPSMYELWYVHFSAENPELSHAIDMAEREGAVSESKCFELYRAYLSREQRIHQVQEAGEQIQTTIRDVNELVADVSESTSQFGKTLNKVTTKLEVSDYSQEEIKSFLKDVGADTKQLLDKNKRLEKELSKQADAMVNLQMNLEYAQREMMLDGLTNIANRKAFDQRISGLVEKAERGDTPTFSLVFMDIDYFKAFNDQYGHQVGDQVLKLVARTLVEGLKGKDFVARYGGEEFAVLLPETNQHAAQRVAENLREAVAAKEVVNRTSGKALGRITMSGGVTEFFRGDNPDDMLERADKALYGAKHKGRNNIQVAEISLVRENKG